MTINQWTYLITKRFASYTTYRLPFHYRWSGTQCQSNVRLFIAAKCERCFIIFSGKEKQLSRSIGYRSFAPWHQSRDNTMLFFAHTVICGAVVGGYQEMQPSYRSGGRVMQNWYINDCSQQVKISAGQLRFSCLRVINFTVLQQVCISVSYAAGFSIFQ